MKCKQIATGEKRAVAFARLGLALIGLGIVLSGCEEMRERGPLWTDYRTRHPIQIVEKDRTLEVFVGGARNGLTPEQRAQVAAFAQSWRGDGTGRFVIERPTRVRNARAEAVALSEIRSILTGTGVPAYAIKVQSYRSPEKNQLAVITVAYPRLSAVAGPCGQWPEDLGPVWDRQHFDNINYWNFGCASQHNLAAMVDNPSDLVQPRQETPAYAGRRTTVLEKYRKGESPSTVYPDASKGSISDLSK